MVLIVHIVTGIALVVASLVGIASALVAPQKSYIPILMLANILFSIGQVVSGVLLTIQSHASMVDLCTNISLYSGLVVVSHVCMARRSKKTVFISA